jgi:hypothetical protein
MPCYRCGARQVDPDRGESPWKRGVRADRQVLICPACQSSVDWVGELDQCPVCASVHLVRRLGEVECRDCGSVREPTGPVGVIPVPSAAPDAPAARPGAAPEAVPGSAPGLASDLGENPSPAAEVELALARVLGRAGRPARIG